MPPHNAPTRRVYSSKAEKYARYRWDYAPEAIDALFAVTGLDTNAVAADIGAGTGILTRHLVPRLAAVLALEPNLEMRVLARQALAGLPGCLVAAGEAESLPLPDGSLDLIAAGQALHWFRPAAARAEFQRVLKPDGWLAFIDNRGSDSALGDALSGLHSGEYGVPPPRVTPPGLNTPLSYYLAEIQEFTFPFVQTQDWEAFLGSLLSASFMPDEDDPGYPRLERAARAVFDRFSRAGKLESEAVTSLRVGRLALDQPNSGESRIPRTNPGPA